MSDNRFPRHKVMMAANAMQAVAQSTASILVLTGEARVWHLMVLAAVRGTGLGFYYPASQGLLPQTVPEGDRAQTNAVARTGRNTAGIGGASLGGILVGLAGPGGAWPSTRLASPSWRRCARACGSRRCPGR
jgi:MFS family permease